MSLGRGKGEGGGPTALMCMAMYLAASVGSLRRKTRPGEGWYRTARDLLRKVEG